MRQQQVGHSRHDCTFKYSINKIDTLCFVQAKKIVKTRQETRAKVQHRKVNVVFLSSMLTIIFFLCKITDDVTESDTPNATHLTDDEKLARTYDFTANMSLENRSVASSCETFQYYSAKLD